MTTREVLIFREKSLTQKTACDYHDVHVGVLMAAARAQQRVYGPQGE